MIKIFREEKQDDGLKTPLVEIVKERMYFVDENGKHLAIAISFIHQEFPISCKTELQRQGYRTDFANWNFDGFFNGFIEDII